MIIDLDLIGWRSPAASQDWGCVVIFISNLTEVKVDLRWCWGYVGVLTILTPGTNDVFVTICLGKERFQTSVKEKAENPVWCEQCELLSQKILSTHLKDFTQVNTRGRKQSRGCAKSFAQKLSGRRGFPWTGQPPPARLWCVWEGQGRVSEGHWVMRMFIWSYMM